jgi:hypothetical protein
MNDLIALQKIAGWAKLKTLVLDTSRHRLRNAFTTWRWTNSWRGFNARANKSLQRWGGRKLTDDARTASA